MNNVKRIEIIIDIPEVPALLAVLREHGADGYSVFSPVTGSGDRGDRRDDEPGGGSANACVLLATPVENSAVLIEAVRPVLRKRGGVCLVSDAQWVVH